MSAKRTQAASKKSASPLPLEPERLTEEEAMLAFAASTEVPSPAIKERLLSRIRASRTAESNVVPAGWKFESASVEAGWRTGALPGVAFKTLSTDETRDVVMVLMRMQPGAQFPDHVHTDGPDEGIVISGDVMTGGRLLKAGDYYFAGEGTKQGETISPNGCTALISLTARAWKKWREHLVSR